MRCALIHGFAGDPQAWDATIAAWRALVEPFAIAVPTAPWDDALALVADRLAGADLVVGYSLGARLALGLVATGRCARAILVSVNPGIPAHERAARRASDAAWAALLRTRGIAAFVDAWEAQPLFASQVRAPATARAARRARRLAMDPEQLARSLELLGLAEMPDYRDAIDDRCALIVGADDAKYVAIARAQAVPTTTLAACGHDPTLEQPAALAAAIATTVDPRRRPPG